MCRILTVSTTVILLSVTVYAQYGSALNNYYPDSYTGSVFTGVVAESGENQITLEFTKGSKKERFTGQFEIGCSVPATDHRLMAASDIAKGTVLTSFFNSATKKVDGKKVKENLIIAISFAIWHEQKVAEDKKKIYWCTNDRHLQFRAF